MRRAAAAPLALLLLYATDASAQLFSPGKLARPHAHLEGVANCTRCHEAGQKVSAKACLSCHTEIATRVDQKKGYHGRLDPAERAACEKCHHDHQGLDYAMIAWDPERFDHRRSGWPLLGAHRQAECRDCHEPRLVTDRALEEKKATTYLGLPVECRSCHFDEHRGQLSTECTKCHDNEAWKPAPLFDHAQTEYPLRGAHREVECAECHAAEKDPAPPGFPGPKSATFARYAPVDQACASCHEDPHRGRLGADCARCHVEDDWRTAPPASQKRGERERSFHDQTRYPLVGAHQAVACRACHLPLGGAKEVFRGLRFGACSDCHLDAHAGQVTTACDDCHGLDAFSPARFGVEAHRATAYPLEGGHLAVACARCHEAKPPAPLAPALVTALKARGRVPLRSAAALELPHGACRDCHADVHRGQLDARRCEDCHGVEDFVAVTFDHDRDSAFTLTGAHRRADCAGCHKPRADGAVQYKPVDARCASCHFDEHLGQLGADCARCHDTERFAWSTFGLARHAETALPLVGRHAEAACATCHLGVQVGTHQLQRYVGLPHDCAGCHADFHRGELGTDCAGCHQATGWRPATYDHAATGWPLLGEHADARCRSCHLTSLHAPLQRACASCHADVHGGSLGQSCAGCHDEKSWRSRFDVAAHRNTAFVLSGAHASTPCEECHADAPSRGFTRANPACLRCHEADLQRAAITSIDHAEAGFSTTCARCHSSWRFSPALFVEHDVCFDLSRGAHRGIGCRECHSSLADARVDGSCDTGTAGCVGCHEHRCDKSDAEHQGVSGYECSDAKCYQCHQLAVR